MRKYLKILLFFLLSISFFGIVNAKDKDITMYFFHGDGCPHCAAEEKFIEEHKDDFKNVKVVKYEVWHNDDNVKLLKKVIKKFDYETNSIPFNVIGNTIITGYSDAAGTSNKILNSIKYYQVNKDKYNDVVKEVLDGNMDVVSVNTEAINYKENNNGKEKKKSNHVIKVPIFGEVDLESVSLGFATVIIGLIDGFNPCAMWVLLFLISVLIGMKDKKKMFIIGFTFLITSALVYMAIMLSWINIVIQASASNTFRTIIAIVALIGGIINLKSYIDSRKKKNDSGCEVVDDKKRKKIFNKIKKFTREKSLLLALLGVIGLAISVNIIELACSAGLPLVFSELLIINKISGIHSLIYVLIYIFFFLIDDIIVFTIAMITMEATGISTKYNKYSHLIGGIIMVIIGILLIFKPGWLMFTFK